MGDVTCCLPECNKPRHCRDMCKTHYEIRRRHRLIDVRPHLSEQERFWAKVNASGVCWEWTGHIDAAGYGKFNARGRTVGSHRFAWESLIGEIPLGLEIDHRCFNPRCVCPDHLDLVTRAENVRRSRRVGSNYCPRGHRRADNQYRSGRPGCKTCTVADNRRRYAPSEPRVPINQCKNGHEFTPENTYFQVKAGGRKSRQCRKCKVINQRRYEANRDGSTHDNGTRNAARSTQATT